MLADDERRLVCEFDTAWGPPTPVLRKLAERMPGACISSKHRNEDESAPADAN